VNVKIPIFIGYSKLYKNIINFNLSYNGLIWLRIGTGGGHL